MESQGEPGKGFQSDLRTLYLNLSILPYEAILMKEGDESRDQIRAD